MLRWLRRVVVSLIVVVALVALLLAVTPQGRTMVQAALFVTQVVPSIPTQTWLQSEPIRERIQVPTPEGLQEADLYMPPGDGPYPAMVLLLGAAPGGAEDERVVAVAGGLARVGMVAMVYWSPALVEMRAHPPDILNLVAAFKYLRSQPFVDPERVGFGGFSIGASFVLVAAANEEVRDQVAFINAFGPYYQLRNLLIAQGTGTREDHGRRIPWTTHPLAKEIATGLLLDMLDSEEERGQVRMALSKGNTTAPDQLPAEARAIFRILAGGTLEEVEAAVEELPPRLLEEMDQLSPESFVEGIRAPVLIMHDRADFLVPVGESRRLARALVGRVDVRYTEFSRFRHVDPSRE